MSGAVFLGWPFTGLPGLIRTGGFPAAELALSMIVVPLVTIIFAKRTWLLGQHFSRHRTVDLLFDYFQSPLIRIIVQGVTVVFVIVLLSILLESVGFLIGFLSAGAILPQWGTWLGAGILVLYVALGGLAGSAQAGAFQTALALVAAVTVTALIVDMAGGSHTFLSDIASLAATSEPSQSTAGRGGGEYNVYFAIPGAIQLTDSLDGPGVAARPWTALTILSSTLALGAIGVSPVFHTWMLGAAAGRRFIPPVCGLASRRRAQYCCPLPSSPVSGDVSSTFFPPPRQRQERWVRWNR